MTSERFLTRSLYSVAMASLAILASGCSTVGLVDADVSKLPGEATESVADSGQPAGAQVTIAMQSAGKDREIRKMPLAGVMRVQEALDEVGATKRFRRMNVRVMRLNGGQRQKLEVKYDHSNRSVKPEYDYVLHPGDQLVVVEDTTTAFDDMLGSLSGAMGLPNR